MIAMSLNVGGGVRLIKPAKLCMCMHNTTYIRTDAQRRVLRQWFRTAEPFRERHYENWNTHTLHVNIESLIRKSWMLTQNIRYKLPYYHRSIKYRKPPQTTQQSPQTTSNLFKSTFNQFIIYLFYYYNNKFTTISTLKSFIFIYFSHVPMTIHRPIVKIPATIISFFFCKIIKQFCCIY